MQMIIVQIKITSNKLVEKFLFITKIDCIFVHMTRLKKYYYE